MAKTFNHNTMLVKDTEGNWNEIPAIVGNGGGEGGTNNYDDLNNKPQINSVELRGNKSLNDLGIAGKDDVNAELLKKLDKPTEQGTSGQVLGLDDELNPIWIDQSVEDKTQLETTDKSSFVGAINELKSELLELQQALIGVDELADGISEVVGV